MKKKLTRFVVASLAIMAVVASMVPMAQAAAPIGDLATIYHSRADLQAIFDAGGNRRAGSKVTLLTLEQWARTYGYKEYPALLAAFAPGFVPKPVPVAPSVLTPSAIAPSSALPPVVESAPRPVSDGVPLPLTLLTANAVVVIDIPSNRVLASHNASQQWPLASLTKLMTSLVSLETGLPMDSKFVLSQADEVGGARLRVATGEPYLVRDLFYAMLVGSANNATNAVARVTGLPKADFVARMNAKARAMGMSHTTFVDPTGIEVENVGTAEEVAALALKAFNEPMIRRVTTTGTYAITTAQSTHTIKNTNKLLLEDNGLYVLGGKTGYLEESRWNLAVKMRDSRNRPVLVVVMGSGSQDNSFKDAATAAKWAWAHHTWTK
jgi:D-alanyl-D-alanine endopeptidase (penicillin-binding protein 7)